MQPLRSALIRNRALASLLVALALCVRALVPSGYMVEAGQRTVTVTICADASGAARQIAVPLGAKHDAGKGEAGKHSDCAFAGMAMALAAPTAPAATLAPQASTPTPFAAQHVAIGRGLAAPPPYQTGPPPTA